MIGGAPSASVQPLPIIAIGGSAGAIPAILALLSELPSGLAAVILIVVHRPPTAPSVLPDIISKKSPVFVHLAREDMALDRPLCLVAAPDKHMVITPQLKIHLVPDGDYRANNIDLLFHSLARFAGTRTIGVILSGMLRDGVKGLREIKDAGGMALVQSPTEAMFRDMPQNAVLLDGSIDFVAPVATLAEEICRLVENHDCKMEISQRR